MFRKTVSDGNYGSETAEVILDLPNGVGQNEIVAQFLAAARANVHAELANSPSYAVKRALEYPKPIEHAQASAEYELAAGLREAYADIDRADDDD
jgi:hypothetical protein